MVAARASDAPAANINGKCALFIGSCRHRSAISAIF